MPDGIFPEIGSGICAEVSPRIPIQTLLVIVQPRNPPKISQRIPLEILLGKPVEILDMIPSGIPPEIEGIRNQGV